MSEPLVPICVRVYRRAADLDKKRKAGQADFPPFNELGPAILRGCDSWTTYFACHGSDWVGHDEIDNLGTGASYGRWLALVPEDFALAASARWPHFVEILDEAACADFYDTRCAVAHDAETWDTEALQAIAALKALGLDADPGRAARIAKALDPLDPARGVRANPLATWAGVVRSRSLQVKPVLPKPIQEAPAGWKPGYGR